MFVKARTAKLPFSGGLFPDMLVRLVLAAASLSPRPVQPLCAAPRKLLRCTPTPVMCSGGGGEGTMVRLDKLLAARGAGSRKVVDRLIRKGAVSLPNADTGELEVVGKAGAKLKVPWESCPFVDGFDYPPPPLLAAYYKPLGVVSSMSDDKGRPDLAAVLPLHWQKLLHPVGRLDADTTGLLLFCRDGDLTHRLLHPKYVVEREYLATVENPVDEARLRGQLAAGVETVEEGESLLVQGDLLGLEGADRQTVRAVFREGKYRMVRRVLANAGHPVVALHRVRYGAIQLDELGIDEGDSVAIDGAALEWALDLKEPSSSARSGGGGAGPPMKREGMDAPAQAPGQSSAPQARLASARTPASPPAPPPPSSPQETEALMEEARRREFRPPAHLVTLVVEEAGVERAEALEALRKHEGDIVKALEEVLGDA